MASFENRSFYHYDMLVSIFKIVYLLNEKQLSL